jgi:hypothetical protein
MSAFCSMIEPSFTCVIQDWITVFQELLAMGEAA